MCVCNPDENFLLQQLDSIKAQTVQPDELIVCDDSSNGSGIEIVDNWAKDSGIVCATSHNPQCLGIVQNFSKALSQTTGQYIFLCDQDDVWRPTKIGLSIEHIQKNEQGGSEPVLFHTDLELINASGKTVGRSFMAKQRVRGGQAAPLGFLLLHNVVTGCSASMNRSLIEHVLPLPNQAIVHDWWIALVAAITGKIVFGGEPLTQYRLHGANTIGLRPLLSTGNVKRFLQPAHIGHDFASVVQQNLAFYARFGDCLPNNVRAFMDQLPSGGFPLLQAAKRANIRPQAWSRNLRFRFAALQGNYKKHLEG